MEPKPNPAQAHPQQEEAVPLAPQVWSDAEEALAKFAQIASDRLAPDLIKSDRRRPALGSDLFAGPRATEFSLDATARRTHANDDPPPTAQRSFAGRASRGLARFALAACIGGAAALAWQSYGDAARAMIANAVPQLDWLAVSPPVASQPSAGEIAGQQANPLPLSAPPADVAQAASVAPVAPAEAALDRQQLETISHDLAVMRDSVAQLAAGQEQMARDIAKLQLDAQDIRRRLATLPPAGPAAARRSVPPPQPAPQSVAAPPALPQSAAPSPAAPPALPQAAAQSSAAVPPPPEPPMRPPMPVR
jgi:hypothetical protein